MVNFDDMLVKLAAQAEIANARQNGDYEKDGLLFCGKCNTPKQCRLPNGSVVYCQCSCKAAEAEAEAQAERDRAMLERVKRLRIEGIQDRAIDRFRFENDNGENSAITTAAKRYVEKWQENRQNNRGLLFYGDVGTGKSFMAGAIVNALIDKGVPCMMTSFPRILAEMQGFNNDKNKVLDSMRAYQLLVIDDLGVERTTEFAQEVVFSVIDARYKAGLPLIVTTNLPLKKLQEPKNISYARIYDRILEICVPVHFEGINYRRSRRADNAE